jgi:hypothetical protein
MDRAGATAYLSGEYAEVVNESGLDAGQATTAYDTAIDMSLRQLGVTEDSLSTADVPQANTISYLALLNYYILKRLIRVFALKFDVAITGSVNAPQSQMYKHLKELLDEAETECVALGFVVGASASTGFSMGRVELDFLEPGRLQDFIFYDQNY